MNRCEVVGVRNSADAPGQRKEPRKGVKGMQVKAVLHLSADYERHCPSDVLSFENNWISFIHDRSRRDEIGSR